MAVKLHPSIDKGLKAGAKKFKGGTLTCHCAADPVTVAIKGNVAHNHACGCTKCWKPDGRQVLRRRGRRPRQPRGHCERAEAARRRCQRRHPAPRLHRLRRAHVRPHREHQLTRSSASTSCTWSCRRTRAGPSRVRGLRVVDHRRRASPSPKEMTKIRARLKKLRLAPYDCLSPPLMDQSRRTWRRRRARSRPDADNLGTILATLSQHACFGGVLGYYQHPSQTNTLRHALRGVRAAAGRHGPGAGAVLPRRASPAPRKPS